MSNTKKQTLIRNAKVVNEGTIQEGDVLIEDGKIVGVCESGYHILQECQIINAEGKYLLPGVIDTHVHFREPGLTRKGDIASETHAAVAGGVTSYMEMPNTIPQTVTQEALSEKFALAAENSFANYSFYIGATNDNIDELLKTDFSKVCGVKLFMGSSTGNMLVEDISTIEKIFSQVPSIIAVHCEDEDIIVKNTELFREKYGENMPIKYHSDIRSEEACYKSSSLAVELAKKYNTKLHILHVSTKKELDLIRANKDFVTGEVCVNYLIFDNSNYDNFGTWIKCNPSFKTKEDRLSLFEGLLDNTISTISTDHAPHTLEEKSNTYFKAPSGIPSIQHSLQAMLEFYHDDKITIEQIVEKMCHGPARLFSIKDRGFIRPGYWADLILVDLEYGWYVLPNTIIHKCKWSSFVNYRFRSTVTHTFVNGTLVYLSGTLMQKPITMPLEFNR